MTPQEELARLMHAHQADVWRYLCLLGCDSAAADDLTQETFIAVMRRPFNDFGAAATAKYLRTTARNLFVNSRRGKIARLTTEELDAADALWARTTPEEDSGARVDALRDCLQLLPERAKRAIELRYRDEVGGAAMALALQTSEEAVKALLARTRAQLRECIERKAKP